MKVTFVCGSPRSSASAASAAPDFADRWQLWFSHTGRLPLHLEQTVGTSGFPSPEPIESTVNELPGLKLPRQFELALLRGNAERLFPKFKLNTRKT